VLCDRPLKSRRRHADAAMVKWLRRRQSRADDAGNRTSESTIGDVGRGIYGPDRETQPVYRFDRVRRPVKRRTADAR
jgi:hypothetical protein